MPRIEVKPDCKKCIFEDRCRKVLSETAYEPKPCDSFIPKDWTKCTYEDCQGGKFWLRKDKRKRICPKAEGCDEKMLNGEPCEHSSPHKCNDMCYGECDEIPGGGKCIAFEG